MTEELLGGEGFIEALYKAGVPRFIHLDLEYRPDKVEWIVSGTLRLGVWEYIRADSSKDDISSYVNAIAAGINLKLGNTLTPEYLDRRAAIYDR